MTTDRTSKTAVSSLSLSVQCQCHLEQARDHFKGESHFRDSRVSYALAGSARLFEERRQLQSKEWSDIAWQRLQFQDNKRAMTNDHSELAALAHRM